VSPWKVIMATMVIFACGVITGAMVSRTVVMGLGEHPPGAAAPILSRTAAGPVLQMQRADFLKRLDKQLDLSDGQREQIGKILKASHERTQPLWNQIAPQMKEELQKVREEIRGELTPEQRKKFGELLRRNRQAEVAPPGSEHPSRLMESNTTATNAL
jgi:Spy/CpxP family protein refolding chaperone